MPHTSQDWQDEQLETFRYFSLHPCMRCRNEYTATGYNHIMGCLYYLYVGCFCRNRIFICFSGWTFHDTIRQHLFIQSDEFLKWQPTFNDKIHSPRSQRYYLSSKKIPENKHEEAWGDGGHQKYFHLLFFPHSSLSSSINKGVDGSMLIKKTETQTYQTQAVTLLNIPPPLTHFLHPSFILSSFPSFSWVSFDALP